MNRKKLWVTLITVGVVAAIAVGAVAYRSAQAAKSTSQVLSYTTAVSQGRGIGFGITDEDLANALGITVDELNTARETARTAAINEAVDKELITQAQADSLLNGEGQIPFGPRWEGWLVQQGIDFQAHLADALGVSVDELNAAVQEARTTAIDNLVAEGKITEEQADLLKGKLALRNSSAFRDAMNSAFEAAVNAAVNAGVITQAQADAILAERTESGLRGLGGFGDLDGLGLGPKGRGGRHGGPGFEMGPFKQFDFDQQVPPIEPEDPGSPEG